MKHGFCLLVLALTLAGCSTLTTGAVKVSPSTATLTARGVCISKCAWHFRYGTTSAYGRRTATKNVSDTHGRRKLTATVTGLSPSTRYRYQLCVRGDGHESFVCVGPKGTQSSFASFTTVAAKRSRFGSYTKPPAIATDQWYWELNPLSPGLAGLPATTGTYPAPGSANIWDTDLFQDSNTNGGVPTGRSPVVAAIHAAGHYSICYVEVGAYQQGFPDESKFATADYGRIGDTATQMQGYPNEYWFDLTGFKNYVAGQPRTLTGAAPNIAAGLDERFSWCKLEGHDAVEPDDLDGYTNKSTSGVTPWGMTQADAAGFERWLAYDIHANGLAAFQKNDAANSAAAAPLFDGMIIEECNAYNDPCTGSGGDATSYLAAHKPVLNAEYTQDGETTAKFCSADEQAGIIGALFDVNLASGTYRPCQP